MKFLYKYYSLTMKDFWDRFGHYMGFARMINVIFVAKKHGKI